MKVVEERGRDESLAGASKDSTELYVTEELVFGWFRICLVLIYNVSNSRSGIHMNPL